VDRLNTHQVAEIISDDHRVLANVTIMTANESSVITLVPREGTGAPIALPCTEVLNLIFSTHEFIYFYKIRFVELTVHDGKPCYLYEVLESKQMKNLRKEERKNVEYQAVISDFKQLGVVTILDISHSGMKIESKTPIDSVYIELFYDESNTSKRAKGEIIWQKVDQLKDVFYYGLNLTYR
jgi:hypothetical protein